jgi:hypothetical protein
MREKKMNDKNNDGALKLVCTNRIKLTRKMGGHVARMGEMIDACHILFEILKGRNRVEDLGADGK